MNNDKIFVKAYTKTDGTEVSAHWRNKGPHADYIPQYDDDGRTQNLTLDGGVSTTDINYVNTTNNPTIASHALEFAKLSANKLQKNTNYLTQNGTIIYSTSELPTEIANAVNTKLYNQIGTKNALGVLYKYNSTISTKIKNSTAINKFISKNIDAIVKNKVIEKSSIEFTFEQDPDLYLAIHYADVLFTTVDQNGNLKILIMDTYDFNPDENPIIDAAHYYQKYGFADPYYVLILLNLKPEEWKKVKL